MAFYNLIAENSADRKQLYETVGNININCCMNIKGSMN